MTSTHAPRIVTPNAIAMGSFHQGRMVFVFATWECVPSIDDLSLAHARWKIRSQGYTMQFITSW
jgi:hypothetical protein